MGKAEFNKKILWFNTAHRDDNDRFKRDLNLKQQVMKCYVWRAALNGDKTWTLQKSRSEITGKF
jgi:hypothetical protein